MIARGCQGRPRIPCLADVVEGNRGMGDVEPAALTLKVVGSLAEVDPAEWDACAGADDPFVGHAFLWALEESGSATARAGWAMTVKPDPLRTWRRKISAVRIDS